MTVPISIVTVALNAADTIADTFKSISSQKDCQIEHIFIDGGSSDRTVEIARKWGPHLSILKTEPDQGVYQAMNKGASLATKEILGFLNSDDFYFDSETISRVCALFCDSNVDAVFGDLQYIKRHAPYHVLRIWKTGHFVPGSFAEGWVPAHPAFFIRRSIFQSAGGFNLKYKYASDFDLLVRLFEIQKISSYYLPKILVNMRDGGLTNKKILNIVRGNIEIFSSLRQNKIKIRFLKFLIKKIILRIIQKALALQMVYSNQKLALK